MFGLFYLKKMGFHGKDVDFDILDAVRFCNDEQDFELVYEIIEYLDFHREELGEMIAKLKARPIPWQYDFVEKVSEASGCKIIQTLECGTLYETYGYALLTEDLDIEQLVDELDSKYRALFQSAAKKMRTLKRNFVLAMECMLGADKEAENLSFRELLEHYVPLCGIDDVINVYKHAVTDEIKLSADERNCLAYAYYSPYFYDDIRLAQGKVPEGSVFSCVEAMMMEDKNYFQKNRSLFEDADDDDDDDEDFEERDFNDDDEEDMLEESEVDDDDDIALSHIGIYMDPEQRCIVDSVIGDNAYAKVYIERLPNEEFTVLLPDFIRYHRGCLYSVEFVENLHELPITTKLNREIMSCYKKIKQLNEEMCADNLEPSRYSLLASKLKAVEGELLDCYFVS